MILYCEMMLHRGFSILILTLLISVEAVNSTNTSSSFNTCYYNNAAVQCPSGQLCAIVPPENSKVRRRVLFPEKDQLSSGEIWFNVPGSRRRKRSSSRRSSSSSRRSSSYASEKGGSTGWRYGKSISQSTYGATNTGITSKWARYVSTWYWWNRSPSPYYRYRESNDDIDNLLENQGICIDEEDVRTMTRQDCYNWCMSLKYDDGACANDCGLNNDSVWDTIWMVLVNTLIIGCVCYACYYYRRKYH